MRIRRKSYYFLAIGIALVLTQGACVLGEVMDANPRGSRPNYAATLEAQSTPTKEMAATETSLPQIEPTPSPTPEDSQELTGVWHGTAQWLCGDNPVWSTVLEIRSNGTVSANLSTSTDTANADGSWEVDGNEILMLFEHGLWVGTITGDAISGTFAEENCTGVWSVTK